MTKRVLLASGATLALASAVRAQGQQQGSNQAADEMLNYQAFHLSHDGKARMMTLNSTGDAAVKKHGTELTGHAILYRNGGKNYVLHDRKMDDGTMLFSQMHTWHNSKS